MCPNLMTHILIKRKFGHRDRHSQREDDVKRPREKMAIDKPRREAWDRPSLMP